VLVTSLLTFSGLVLIWHSLDLSPRFELSSLGNDHNSRRDTITVNVFESRSRRSVLENAERKAASPVCPPQNVRLGLVLSAGGLRGAGHLGVLRQLVEHRVPIDVIVGVSAGAIVAGYYAAAGFSIDSLVADAERLRGRHLLVHGLNVHLGLRFDRALRGRSGIIPDRLLQLERATFDRLHAGVHRLGIVCHDIIARETCYFWTGDAAGVALADAVKASASIPGLFRGIDLVCDGRRRVLIDGGISDPVPLAFARRLGATHVIVSDARWVGTRRPSTENVLWIRPRMSSTGTLWAPRHSLTETVAQAEAAVTASVIAQIKGWLEGSRSPGVALAS
jgi:NTE family protein